MKPIPYGKQNITEKDIKAVVEVLKSDYITQGPKISEFEKAFAEYVDSKFAVAVSSGTAALHLCAIALNVSKGVKVITSPITFAASANCIRYCGGEVVFGDIDPETYLLDIKSVRNLLESAPKGTYSGIIPVNFAGRAIKHEEFRELADDFNLWIIEDSCHAPGGYSIDSTGGKSKCGSGKFAELSIFSFHPVKHIACGEGGMITTNDKDLYTRLLKLRSHGIEKNNDLFQNSIEDATGGFPSDKYPNWYMEMQDLGYNYRISDIQAALGISQLGGAKQGLALRREIAKRYFEAFENEKKIIRQSGWIEGHAYHLYVIEVENRLGLYNHLLKNLIFCQVHYVPCHLMPYYRQRGWKKGDRPHSEKYYKQCLSLPIYPTLNVKAQQKIISLVKNFLRFGIEE
jgi:UDP-4-amino-4,6-dideoxy-N-acetyl-beta-L-altrosamine transaminase